jgi:hypothetical protein
MVIPIPERYALLRHILDGFVDEVAKLKKQNPNLAAEQPLFFLFLVYPWVADATALTAEQKDFLERRKLEIRGIGFNGEKARTQLEEILRNDNHLSECCPTPLLLASYFDSALVTVLADSKLQGAAQARIDFAYDEFERLTYHQGRFRRIALSHLFNLDIDGNSALLEGDKSTLGDIRIERLDERTIPEILGETGRLQSFLHLPGTGNCFVVEEETASNVGDMTWLAQKREKALYFAQVLQYFQNGVVHLGYSVPVFMPDWASRLRLNGVFFLGTPRQLRYAGGTKLYRLTDKERLAVWWKAATTEPIIKAIQSKEGKLRQAIYRAGTYYESSHERTEVGERLIALSIAVESLFSPTDQVELKFRIAQSAAQFIGKIPEERKEIFAGLSDMYNRRSKLVHGSYDIEKFDRGEFVNVDQIDIWADYVRRALVGFLTLYLKNGKSLSRDSILERIAGANFDDASGEALRGELDLQSFFEELNGKNASVTAKAPETSGYPSSPVPNAR